MSASAVEPCVKISHPTREHAEVHLKSLVWMNESRGESHLSAGLNVYPCDQCPAWHVGHQKSIGRVWHYTIGRMVDGIDTVGELRPRRPQHLTAKRLRRMSPKEHRNAKEKWDAQEPLLWFSRNENWEQSVIKIAPAKPFPPYPPKGRCWHELSGDGLFRFGVLASVARLRWGDFLARNPMPIELREAMTRRGNPVEWLATDQPVPREEWRSFEMYCRGAWVPVESLEADEIDGYLKGRFEVYTAAWNTLVETLGGIDRVAAGDFTPPTGRLSEAEAILYEDLHLALRERGAAWARGNGG